MAHEHVGDVDGVVHGDGVAAADGTEEADGDDELQDGGHSKHRWFESEGDSGRPLLPPPIAPGSQVPPVASAHAAGDGQDCLIRQ